MKIACQEGMAPGQTLSEKLKNLEAYGYEGIEFWGRDLWDREKDIVAALKKSSVKASTICAGYRGCLLDPKPEERQMAVEDMKRLLDVAAAIGAVGLICVPIFGPPRVPDLSPYKTARQLEDDLIVELVADIGKHAKKAGAVLLLEPLNRYETHFHNRLEQAVTVAKEVRNTHVRIMADFFHMSIEERDIAASILEAGNYIYHVHLADSTRKLPGYGHTDWAAGFAALKKVKYDKYMALECGIPGDPTVELPKCAKFLRQYL